MEHCTSGFVFEPQFPEKTIFEHAFVPTFWAIIHAYFPGLITIMTAAFLTVVLKWLFKLKNKKVYMITLFCIMFVIIVFWEGCEITFEGWNIFICNNTSCQNFWRHIWFKESAAKKYYDIIQGILSILMSLTLINLTGFDECNWKSKKKNVWTVIYY